jgi:hypothetical protein
MEMLMSTTLLYIEFGFPGPWGDELAQACRDLATDIANEPGLHWKLWAEDANKGVASGVYVFASREQAGHYLEKHLPRLATFGVTNVDARMLDVNRALSLATRTPLTA